MKTNETIPSRPRAARHVIVKWMPGNKLSRFLGMVLESTEQDDQQTYASTDSHRCHLVT
jgi:hypothetical protein